MTVLDQPIRPLQAQRAADHRIATCLSDRNRERPGQHETVTDDCDLRAHDITFLIRVWAAHTFDIA